VHRLSSQVLRLSLISAKVDRREDYYQNFNITFPHQDGLEFNQKNTVLDGELVIDVDQRTGQVTPTCPRPESTTDFVADFPSLPSVRLSRIGRRKPNAETID
jgi:hypothetical protein